MTTHEIRFPPFPPTPTGVDIIPFSKFTECGIQIELGAGDSEEELDGRGIPTVELRTKHNTDESKSEARRQKKSKQKLREEAEEAARARERAAKSQTTTTMSIGKPLIKEWWHDWEEGESLRRTVVDLSLPPLDRINQAVLEFWKHRRWPTHSLGVFHSWDKFRYYIGILDNPDHPIHGQKTVKHSEDAENEGDEMSDEEEYADQGPTVHNVDDGTPREKKPHRAFDSETLKDPPQPPHTAEEKLAAFLADPERGAKVFLSSYMRARGIMWSERNLIYVPRLLIFFFEYVIRSAIFDPTQSPFQARKGSTLPASDIKATNEEMRRIHQGFVGALAIAQKALAELPLTAVMAQWVDPFSFSDGAKTHWGKKADGYKTIDCDPPTGSNKDKDASTQDVGGEADQDGEGHVEVQRCVVEVTGLTQGDDEGGKKKKGKYSDAGPSAKRAKILDDDDDIETQVERMKVPELDDKLIDAKTALEDNMDVDVIIRPPWMKDAGSSDKGKKPAVSVEEIGDEDDDPPAGGWGGWGSTEASGWGAENAESSSALDGGWGATTTSADDWTVSATRTLDDVLGNSATITKTHAPGIVESSLRRIKAILRPGEGLDAKDLRSKLSFETTDPAQMESQLARRFVRVVMEPWLNTDVFQKAGENSMGRMERRTPHASRHPGLPGKGLPLNGRQRLMKVHNIVADEITILIDAQGDKEAEVLDILQNAIGMGLGGYFVELARLGDFKRNEAHDSDSDVEMDDWDDRVEEDGGDDGRRYWYMEELTRVYPSYWMPLGLKKERPSKGRQGREES